MSAKEYLRRFQVARELYLCNVGEINRLEVTD